MTDRYFKSRFLYKKKKRRILNLRALFFIAIVLGMGAAAFSAYSLAYLDYWQIKFISVSVPESVEKDDVYAAIQESFDEKAAFFIPKSNYFFVSAASLAERIQRRLPRIRDVRLEKKFPDTLLVSASEREVYAIYCWSGIEDYSASTTLSKLPMFDPREDETCFYIDREGVMFESAVFVESRLFPIIHADEIENFVEGESRLPAGIIDFFEAARFAMKEKTGITLVSLTLSRDIPKDYILGTNFGWFAVVPRDASVSEWVLHLKTVLDSKIRTRLADVEYVDLRFGSKVFYKYR